MSSQPPMTLWSILVLASLAIAGIVMWLRQRKDLLGRRRAGLMQVIDSLPLGPRERVVMIEVDGQRLLIGVTAQAVCQLHDLGAAPAGEAAARAGEAGASNSFGNLLNRARGQ
ncbi:MAG: flagellar biosynthetic protein FliO [Burkholderiaceae bacterium]